MAVRARKAAQDVVRCCRSLWEAGLIAGTDGNISVKLGPDRVLVTPQGMIKSELRPDDLVQVDLGGSRTRGYREATTELDLHLRVYRRREDCGAVVHAHPPAATGLAVAGQGLPGNVLPEIALLMGEVPCVPYATSGTPALGDAVEPFLDRHVCAPPGKPRRADLGSGPGSSLDPNGKPGAWRPDPTGRPCSRQGESAQPGPDRRLRADERKPFPWPKRPRKLK